MGQLLHTLAVALAFIAATVGLFVGANALVDLAPKRFTLYATLAGGLVGAVVGVLANSGGWFLGGPVWPLGGAALGALAGRFVWANHPPAADRRWRIPERWRPVIFLAPALLFLGVTLVVPALRTIYLSFRSRRGDEAVGAANYRDIFGDNKLFNVDSAGAILSSRLFIVGTIVAIAALAWVIGRGVSTRRCS
jgi:hypothetical protein